MKRFILLVLSLITLLVLKTFAQSPVPFDMVGFATLNGGTTGGLGGTTVTVTTFTDFRTYAETSNTPYTILVSGHLVSGDDKGASVRVANNKTIIGIGSDAFLDGIGLNISSKSNIIIRNLKFTLTSITNTTDPAVYSPTGDEGRPQILVNGGDCIKIQSSSSNIWIDHCEFYQENPSVQTNQDLYDGLIDVTGNSRYITISWCYFHDHHKCSLVGSSDSDNYDRMITFHHNYYKNIRERTPSYRFGKGHMFNNYYLSVSGSGINSRMGACLKIESNSFENSKDAVVAKSSSSIGYWDLSDNLYTNSTGSQPATSNCSYSPPYSYSVVLENKNDVKNTVQTYSGVGVLTISTNQSPTTAITSPVNNTIFTNTNDIAINADAGDTDGSIIKVNFYNGLILLGTDYDAPYAFQWDNVAQGTYSITAIAHDNLGSVSKSSAIDLEVDFVSGLLGSSNKVFKNVYPNPSRETFLIHSDKDIKHIWIMNMHGFKVEELKDLQAGKSMQIGEDLQDGSYVLVVEYTSGNMEVGKIVKIQ